MSSHGDLERLPPAELSQLRGCLGDAKIELPPHHGLSGRHLFLDMRHSRRDVRSVGDGDIVHDRFDAVVVTDRHALAAHEFWHRATQLLWAAPKDGFSGALLDVSQDQNAFYDDPTSVYEGPVGGVAAKLLSVAFVHNFKSIRHRVVVDFSVTELGGGEFLVEILGEEMRQLGEMPDQKDPGFLEYWMEYKPVRRKVHKQIVGTSKARGTIRMIDVLDGLTGSKARLGAERRFAKRGFY
mmetsp:Transcript_163231/g.523598  ORF Transcript_163231/g.523598 Transcript_163231/m.523598 type:complete len:239 (-) Transcript_163231:37-753(-)